MTPAEFIAAVEAVEVRWPLRMLEPNIKALRDMFFADDVELQLTLKTPHRDTGVVEDGVTVRARYTAAYLAALTPSYAAISVRQLIMGALEHELDESLWFGGERVFEPHKEPPP